MLARVTTFAVEGVDPRRVAVEVDIRVGLPAFTIVGLGDAAVRESRERIRAAILNSNFEFPQRRITANLAPASMRKAGPGFDAALAVAVLAASGQLPFSALDTVAVLGELSLGGEVLDAAGALVVAEGARRHGIKRLLVPAQRAHEAALVTGVQVIPVSDLREAVAVLGGRAHPRMPSAPPAAIQSRAPDLCEVRGHRAAIAALEIAAAGGHNVLLEGPPGTGKTMLARRLPSILPPLTSSEALEVTRIESICGRSGVTLAKTRPFRAPHHSISVAGLIGGGSTPRIGELTRAHLGVLFLDELAEFQRSALEALRQPLEDGRVTIVRAQGALTLPTRCMLVAAANPCPCGYAGVGERCTCADTDLQRYRRRLSGPLIDRMDLLIDVGRPTDEEMQAPPATTSEAVLARVAVARERQIARLGQIGVHANAGMDAHAVQRFVRVDSSAQQLLSLAYSRGSISARGRYRLLRVAQTIADLAGRDGVQREDLLRALAFRQRAAGESASSG